MPGPRRLFGVLIVVTGLMILTRDTWMHRVDISRATGRDLVLTAEHDGRIVADVVDEDVVALVAELMGRSLHYDSMLRIGI